DVERYHFYNVMNRPLAELEGLLARVEAPGKPINWIGQSARQSLGEVGVLNIPTPEINIEAWHRRPYGSRAYAICGITHTTATATVMRTLPDLLVAPLEDYDALICTSSAVRESVETQLTAARDYMRQEYGPRRRREPQRVTIPLGVNAADFAARPDHRKAWRERLGIPADGVVALYVGRFNVRSKMNPALMAMALERSVQRTGQPIWWVNSGWGATPEFEAEFHEESRKLCPSVHYCAVDGRPADVRFSIWSVADFFISFSDNVQETFGLTPIEAMAAGLPCVVSDWNGYKDTVRHGIDGFRVPTLAPRPGMGADLAYAFSNGWISYDNYVGAAGQTTVVDLDEAERLISALVTNEGRRRRLGDVAQKRVREAFDWSVIIPQYQALWAEQDARRRAAGPDVSPRDNPMRPDPFTLFANYPTRHLSRADRVQLRPGMTWQAAEARLEAPLAVYSRYNRPTLQEAQAVIAYLADRPKVQVGEILQQFPERRRAVVERGLLWLARHDVIEILPDS
ncbi:MAG: glycosyltransferase family 4 protein, partial [Phenylobacterium sp.]